MQNGWPAGSRSTHQRRSGCGFAALAEFERELISERTIAGLASARARGRKGGRPFKMTPAKLRLATASMGQPDTKVGDLCTELGSPGRRSTGTSPNWRTPTRRPETPRRPQNSIGSIGLRQESNRGRALAPNGGPAALGIGDELPGWDRRSFSRGSRRQLGRRAPSNTCARPDGSADSRSSATGSRPASANRAASCSGCHRWVVQVTGTPP